MVLVQISSWEFVQVWAAMTNPWQSASGCTFAQAGDAAEAVAVDTAPPSGRMLQVTLVPESATLKAPLVIPGVKEVG